MKSNSNILAAIQLPYKNGSEQLHLSGPPRAQNKAVRPSLSVLHCHAAYKPQPSEASLLPAHGNSWPGSIPLLDCVSLLLMYAVAVLLGNTAVLLVVRLEPALHQPMYLFLCMLSTIDLVLCTSTVPKLLALFWANAAEIAFGACAAQMFFIRGFSAAESGILLAMAFDRYLAICRPLHYGSLLPPESVGKLGAAAVLRGLGLMTPLTCLLARLTYCSRVVAHSYCEHMAVVKLACGGTQPNDIYGITAATLAVGTDSICIAISYALILRAVLGFSSKEASVKTFGTCGSHLGVILLFYTPGLFSFYTQHFGQHVPRHVHILLADLYLIVPPMLNPIIYGMKTKQIRDGALRLMERGSAQS